MYEKINCNSLGQFKRSREKMVHQSRDARMIDNPMLAIARAKNEPFFGPKMIPWQEQRGHTFNVGRNAQKRSRRITH